MLDITGFSDSLVRQKMKESGNPKASALFAGAFVCAMAGAACAVAIDDAAIGGMLFCAMFLAALVSLIAGIVIGWRERKKQYEFVEPTTPVPRFFLRAFRIVAGLLLTASGGFMIWLSFAMQVRGESFPAMGFLMGATIGCFGLKGLIAGSKKRPSKSTQTRSLTRPA